MPELPEVETVRRGLEERIVGRVVMGITVRQAELRWPVPWEFFQEKLPGARVVEVGRRGKYLWVGTEVGAVLVHLGMSGVLRVLPEGHPLQPHDHLDFHLEGEVCLRYTDPRRFGSVLWGGRDPLAHALLASLGPEPLEEAFHGAWLARVCQGRRRPVKSILMDSRMLAGVGNIYAVESLFSAGIHPLTPGAALDEGLCQRLAASVKETLSRALACGGTTLRDFRHEDGKPGYFQQYLQAYGREGQPCGRCAGLIEPLRLGGRATPFCPRCQPLR